MVDEPNSRTTGDLASKAKERVGQFVEEIKEKAGPAFESARGKIVEQAGLVKDRVSESAEALKAKSFNEIGDDINRYVKNNPGKVVIGAFACGIILGSLLRGRGRD